MSCQNIRFAACQKQAAKVFLYVQGARISAARDKTLRPLYGNLKLTFTVCAL